MKTKVNITRMSDDDIQDRFTEVFEREVCAYNNIESCECLCKREDELSNAMIEVMIVGMAGSPTLSEFKDGKVENSEHIEVEYEDRGKMYFKLIPEKTLSLNTNDYVVFYEMV